MSLEALRNRLPEYAKDQKLNLGSLATEPVLNEQQRAGAFIASAIAARNPEVTKAVTAEFGPKLSPEALNAAKAAASIMGMNNIYYRFTHAVTAKEYASMRAGLRMNIIAQHGVSGTDFELWCLAVSAINGCSACMDSHEKAVVEKGVTREVVQAVVKIASVIHAVAVTLEAEATVPTAVPA